MSAPLTTRDALAEALREGLIDSRHLSSLTHQAKYLADALLASGALTDVTKLADRLGFICDEWVTTQASRPEAHGVARGMAAEIRTALAAALSAQSERAEVEG